MPAGFGMGIIGVRIGPAKFCQGTCFPSDEIASVGVMEGLPVGIGGRVRVGVDDGVRETEPTVVESCFPGKIEDNMQAEIMKQANRTPAANNLLFLFSIAFTSNLNLTDESGNNPVGPDNRPPGAIPSRQGCDELRLSFNCSEVNLPTRSDFYQRYKPGCVQP